tara:strand:+ start:2457 stop:2732 length:276 start_codon:yes stop_codon:yes gene_type:complete
MANITLSETPDTVVSGFDQTKLLPNTATAVITPYFSSLDRVSGIADTPQNYDIEDLDRGESPRERRRSTRGFLRGRRPYFGLLFPRGYYNR